MSKFWKLKKAILGVPTLHLYDTYAPISKESVKKYTESEAEELLYEALSILGSEYITDLKKSFKEHWIDFCPNEGKRNGAYCTACYNVHPYVLLSFNGTLESVSTLAHELGHAMHYYYAIKNQSFEIAELKEKLTKIMETIKDDNNPILIKTRFKNVK